MFSIGIAPRRNSENRHRHRNRNPQRRHELPSTTVANPWSRFSIYNRWNLLPIEKFTDKGLYYSMSFDYPSFASRYLHFMKFPTRIGTQSITPELPSHSLKLQQEAKEMFFLNQRLRFQFKRLISAYLLQKMPIKNEVDPITLEVPRQPVFLHDHANRCTFQFEAKELLRDFSTRLLTHDDLFPCPLCLRNPFTNAKLHIGQILSLYRQIKSFGQMHWTVECFKDARFSLKLFQRDNMRKLRLSALRNLMKSPQCVDFLLDFIEAQHDSYNKQFDLRTYRWALERSIETMERIRSWKFICLCFYEVEITEDDFVERQRKINKLAPIILRLCSPCDELYLARRGFPVAKV
jgi:hypothetical protein